MQVNITSGIHMDSIRQTLRPWTAVTRLPAKEEQQGLAPRKQGDKGMTTGGEQGIEREDERGRRGELG
jgi:hypothetical protein